VLTHNLSNIEKITFFMEECKRMGAPVLGPDVNESEYMFTVNKKSEIRFGLGAIKGIGEGAVDAIVRERKENGPYKDMFDLVRRVDLKSANKRCFENLVLAGALDSFNITRAQYFYQEAENQSTFLEKLIKYGAGCQSNSNAAPNLFGEETFDEIGEPKLPAFIEWPTLKQLSMEKEVVGIFLSGHPLDDYKLEIDNFCTYQLASLSNIKEFKGKDIAVGGIVTEVVHRTTKTGKPFGLLSMEDYSGSFQFALFGDDYINFRKYMIDNYFLFIKGKVQSRRWGNPEDVEFKIGTIQLLPDIKETLVKGLNLNIALSDLTEELIGKIENLAKNNVGKCRLNFTIYDRTESNLSVEMPSKNVSVDLNKEFLEKIKALKTVDITLKK
nr:DNA polymerase III subunit alpha [Bacteroidota bacterium]